MQDPHVLHVGPFPTPFPECVIGEAEAQGEKQRLPGAVTGKGSGLAHQRPDETGRDGVGQTGYLDGAPLAHLGPVVDVFRYGSWRQRHQASHFLLQLPLYQVVAPGDHLPDEVGVVVGGVEVAAAPEHQRLVDGILEAVVFLLGDAVFMALAVIDAGGAEAVVVQQGGVVVVKRSPPTAFHLVGGSRGIVARTTSGTPPRVQRADCRPCCNARKVSPAASSA